MKPVDFPEAQTRLRAPDGMDDCGTLAVFRDGTHCLSCWEVEPEDLERLKAGGRVWLIVYSGMTQPPVALQTECPLADVECAIPPGEM